MGIELRFFNPDQLEQKQAPPDAPPTKTYKRVKDNAISTELYEIEGEADDDAEAEPEPEPEPEAEDEEDDQEEKRDPLNTYVVAFWNPRHKDFQARFYEFLQLADPEVIKSYTGQSQVAESGMTDAYNAVAQSTEGGEAPAEQESPAPPPPKKEEEFKPYLKLYCCIQGTRQINIGGYEKKIPGMTQFSKVILDNDWLFKKIQVIFNEKLTARTDQVNDGNDVGFFYVYNRQFKNI